MALVGIGTFNGGFLCDLHGGFGVTLYIYPPLHLSLIHATLAICAGLPTGVRCFIASQMDCRKGRMSLHLGRGH